MKLFIKNFFNNLNHLKNFGLKNHLINIDNIINSNDNSYQILKKKLCVIPENLLIFLNLTDNPSTLIQRNGALLKTIISQYFRLSIGTIKIIKLENLEEKNLSYPKFEYNYSTSYRYNKNCEIILDFMIPKGNYFIELKTFKSKIGIFYTNQPQFYNSITFENLKQAITSNKSFRNYLPKNFKIILEIKDIKQIDNPFFLKLLNHFTNLRIKIPKRPPPPIPESKIQMEPIIHHPKTPPLSSNKIIKKISIIMDNDNIKKKLRMLNNDLFKKIVGFQAQLEKDDTKTNLLLYDILAELEFNKIKIKQLIDESHKTIKNYE